MSDNGAINENDAKNAENLDGTGFGFENFEKK